MKNWFSKLKPREQNWVWATGGIILACLFYRSAAAPVLDRLDGLHRETALRAKQWTAYQRTVAGRDQVLRVADRYLYLMQGSDSDDEETSRLLKEVESIARSAQVTVMNLKPRPVENSNMVKWYEVVIDTESSLEALTRFVYEIEQSPLLLRVDRLDAKQDEKLQNPLKATLQISKVVIS